MRRPRIAVVDYGMGNLRSVQKALEKAGAEAVVTDSPRVIKRSEGVVLPGVGAFGEAAARLKQAGLWKAIEQVLKEDRPFLGICLGLQLLFERSEENPGVRGFGFLKGSVVRFRIKNKSLKVPHMGWNQIKRGPADARRWLKGLKGSDYFYFVHSYFPKPADGMVVAATTPYGGRFCSAVARRNVFASQFHPEKSGAQGLQILSNFVRQVAQCS